MLRSTSGTISSWGFGISPNRVGWVALSAPTQLATEKPPPPVRRYWEGAISFAGGQLRQAGRAPVTLAIVIILWVAGAVTGSLAEGPHDALLFQVGAGVRPLLDGYLWTPLTAAFFALS